MASRRRKRTHGSGEVVPPKLKGGTWGIRYRLDGKRHRRGGFASEDIARRVLAKLMGDIALDRAELPRDPSSAPTLEEEANGFFERRKLTHRAGAEDHGRWRKHLGPFFGKMKPDEVDVAKLRAFVELKLKEGLNPATIRICITILSSFYADLVERRVAKTNPCVRLPKSLVKLMRPTHDPRTTPFIEKLSDVRRIYLALRSPLNVAYAIGALAGLRTGEVFALKWRQVDLAARRIHVRESVKGPLKDKDSRVVPILDSLAPILAAWKLESGGDGLVIPPLRCDGGKVDKHTPGTYLRAALKKLDLDRPGLGWYEATRHTFASQWVMSGGSIEKLKEMLGHYSVVMTERYAHLKPELFTPADLGTIAVDLQPAGEVAKIGS
jgi:integrase/recombinase XerD